MKRGSEGRARPRGRGPGQPDPRSTGGNPPRASDRAASALRSPIGWVLLIALATAGVVLWRSGSHPRRPRAMATAADALEPLAAYREAVAKVGASRLRESLPYFQRALDGLSTDFCEIHYNYGVTLAALSMQYRPRAGLPVPATHSSVERVGLVREALAQLDRAARLAPDTRARVGVSRYRTVVWTSWGFPWEAMAGFQDTRSLDSTDTWNQQHLAHHLAVMRNPSGPRFVSDSLKAP